MPLRNNGAIDPPVIMHDRAVAPDGVARSCMITHGLGLAGEGTGYGVGPGQVRDHGTLGSGAMDLPSAVAR